MEIKTEQGDQIQNQGDDQSDNEKEIDPLKEENQSAENLDGENKEKSVNSKTLPQEEQDAVQKKINKITAEKGAEQRKRIAAENELSKFKAEKAQDPGKAPTLEDFDHDEIAYQDAKIEHQVKSQLRKNAISEEKNRIQSEKKQLADNFTKKEELYMVENPDYKEAISKLPALRPDILEAIYNLEPNVSHFLGKHLDVAHEINAMSPLQAAIRLGEIKSQIKGKPKINTTTTNAPPPVETIGGKGAVHKSIDNMSMDEIMALDV